MACGFDEDSFWRKAPVEIDRALIAWRELHEREHNDRAWLAWHIAALTRAKKLQPLKSLQAKPRRRPQTWQEQLSIARAWASVAGGKITTAEDRRANG